MKIINQVAKNKPVKFFGSPFSAPRWLKNNGALQGGGILKETAGSKTWKTYANYIFKLSKKALIFILLILVLLILYL